MIYTKKVENKECPYRDTIIIIGSGKPIYWCALFGDKKQCIFNKGKEDAGECSYYLFPPNKSLFYFKWIYDMACFIMNIPLYTCSKCGKDINDPEKAHIGILTVLCEECAFKFYNDEIIKRYKKSERGKEVKSDE